MSATGVNSLVFLIHQDEDGGYWAEAEGHAIFTQGETLDELSAMITDAAACHFDDWEEYPRPPCLVFRR